MTTLTELSIIETFDLINKDKKLSKQILIDYINSINENEVNISSLFNCIKNKNNKFKLYLSNTVLKHKLSPNTIYKKVNFENNNEEYKPNVKSKIINNKSNKLNTNTNTITQDELDNMINNLSDEQLEAFEYMQTGRNLFITGSAGCGKSHIIKTIIKSLTLNKKIFGVTSSTGCSAITIDGSTLHSFLGIGLGNLPVKVLYEELLKKKYKNAIYNKLKKLEILIIDEISMINGDLFTLIDQYLKLIKNNKEPFGGIQMILSGDFFQLLPVKNNFLCFESDAWKNGNFILIELIKSFRQEDQKFVDLLNELRLGNCTDEILEKLNETKHNIFPDGIIPINLYTTNKDVDTENINIMKKLKKTIYTFDIKKHDKSFDDKNLNKLEICEGSQVMITYNIDPKNQIINGKIGIVDSIDFYGKVVTLKLFDKNNNPYYYNISYISKDNEYYDSSTDKIIKNILYEYLPLRLAYCITTHKSQSMSIEYLNINFSSGAFAPGQSFVALSRGMDLNKIRIENISKNDFYIDERVKNFYNK